MYAKRIQIRNYGPIDHVDITFPFTDGDENPKPVLLVGENGSGKSILLSNIVDGLMLAQGVIYPENSEVERGGMYKIRDFSYIKSGRDYCWIQTDFEKGLFCKELLLRQKKGDDPAMPAGLNESDNCVQRLDDSLNCAIHTTYRSVLRSSSMHEPRGPPLEVVLFLMQIIQMQRKWLQ